MDSQCKCYLNQETYTAEVHLTVKSCYSSPFEDEPSEATREEHIRFEINVRKETHTTLVVWFKRLFGDIVEFAKVYNEYFADLV